MAQPAAVLKVPVEVATEPIRIAGGGADSADCGAGRDKAITRGADTTSDCETVVAD